MRIVSRAQLMAMPEGTVYMENSQHSYMEGQLCVKGETIPTNDWFTAILITQIAAHDSGEESDLYNKAEADSSVDVPLSFDGYGRDGCYDDNITYCVWSDADVGGLIDALTTARATAKGSS